MNKPLINQAINALERMQKMHELMMSQINFSASYFNASAFTEMNSAPEQCNDTITALREALAQTKSLEWQLVPVKPTQKMLAAASQIKNSNGLSEIIYESMIKAAPALQPELELVDVKWAVYFNGHNTSSEFETGFLSDWKLYDSTDKENTDLLCDKYNLDRPEPVYVSKQVFIYAAAQRNVDDKSAMVKHG